MKGCKYLLPCGWCERLDKHCSATAEHFEKHNYLNHEKCNHDWSQFQFGENGLEFICSNCGAIKPLYRTK